MPGWAVVAHVKGLSVDGLRVEMSEEDFLKHPRSALIGVEAPDAAVRNVVREPAGPPDAPPVTKFEKR